MTGAEASAARTLPVWNVMWYRCEPIGTMSTCAARTHARAWRAAAALGLPDARPHGVGATRSKRAKRRLWCEAEAAPPHAGAAHRAARRTHARTSGRSEGAAHSSRCTAKQKRSAAPFCATRSSSSAHADLHRSSGDALGRLPQRSTTRRHERGGLGLLGQSAGFPAAARSKPPLEARDSPFAIRNSRAINACDVRRPHAELQRRAVSVGEPKARTGPRRRRRSRRTTRRGRA